MFQFNRSKFSCSLLMGKYNWTEFYSQNKLVFKIFCACNILTIMAFCQQNVMV